MNDMHYNPKGNLAFMTIIATAAVLSAAAIGMLGLNNISLAILIVLTVGSVLFGKLVENWITAREEKAREKLDL